MAVHLSSQRNKRKFVDEQSYVYVLNNKNKDGSVEYWTCEEKIFCRAKVHVSNDKVIRAIGNHTHGPSVQAVNAQIIVNEIDREATQSQHTARNIIRDAVCNKDDGVLAALPSRSTLCRRIQRARRRLNPTPALPTARHGFDIPDQYTKTTDGRRFLFHDSGVDDCNRILIFTTDDNLDAMVTYNNWFMDGTFKCAPDIFYQIFSIHILLHGSVYPVVYALLPNKQQATYERFFVALNSLRQFNPTTVSSDFEMAILNAVNTIYPSADTCGCFFHFCQCIYRKVQDCGLQAEYSQIDFNMFIRMMAALAFVPVGSVIDSYETLLEAHAPQSAQPVIDYFEDNFIGM